MPITIGRLAQRSVRRRWLQRLSVAATALVAGYHVYSTRDIVDPIAASALAADPKNVAIVLWHFSSVIFVSIPIALAWSFRAPAERGRPLQAYIAVLVGGLSIVVVPVALTGFGPSGLLLLPQWLFGLVIVALIVSSMPPDADRSFNSPSEPVSVTPESGGVVAG